MYHNIRHNEDYKHQVELNLLVQRTTTFSSVMVLIQKSGVASSVDKLDMVLSAPAPVFDQEFLPAIEAAFRTHKRHDLSEACVAGNWKRTATLLRDLYKDFHERHSSISVSTRRTVTVMRARLLVKNFTRKYPLFSIEEGMPLLGVALPGHSNMIGLLVRNDEAFDKAAQAIADVAERKSKKLPDINKIQFRNDLQTLIDGLRQLNRNYREAASAQNTATAAVQLPTETEPEYVAQARSILGNFLMRHKQELIGTSGVEWTAHNSDAAITEWYRRAGIPVEGMKEGTEYILSGQKQRLAAKLEAAAKDTRLPKNVYPELEKALMEFCAIPLQSAVHMMR